jgi:peptidoglycan hydrolase-like amidase
MLKQALVFSLTIGLGFSTSLPTFAQSVSPIELTATKAVSAIPLNAYRDVNRIRVGISDDAMIAQEYPSTRISATGAFTITDQARNVIIFTGMAGDTATVTVDKSGFNLIPITAPRSGSNGTVLPILPKPPSSAFLPPTVPEMGFPPANITAMGPTSTSIMNPPTGTTIVGPLLIQTVKATDRLKIANITRRKEVPEYRGIFQIVRGSSGASNKLSVVNVLSLEDYLKAVVPNELPMRYGWEAVKAQTIAARNYAIHPREKPWRNFDICDSQLCQVYLGAQTETPSSNRAIAETEGLIGLYDGEPILALFSSSHGGYAENYSNAFSDPVTKQFPAPEIPYLRGGLDLPLATPLDLTNELGAKTFWSDPTIRSYDVDSPFYRWTKRWSREAMEAALNEGLLYVSKDPTTKFYITPLFKPGQTVGALQNLTITQRGLSGKAMTLVVEGSNGSWTVNKEFLIRRVLRNETKTLPSANLILNIDRNPATQEIMGITANGGGFGHGVGLSQLGASWMSKHGYNFVQIVQHYYQGVSLGSMPVIVGGLEAGTPVAMPMSTLIPGLAIPTGMQRNSFSVATASFNQPAITRFGVSNPVGTLWLQEGENGIITPFNRDTVEIMINGKHLNISPDGYRSGIPIGEYLQAHQVNSLTLMPDAQHSTRRLKAWIELFAPNVSTKPTLPTK